MQSWLVMGNRGREAYQSPQGRNSGVSTSGQTYGRVWGKPVWHSRTLAMVKLAKGVSDERMLGDGSKI